MLLVLLSLGIHECFKPPVLGTGGRERPIIIFSIITILYYHFSGVLENQENKQMSQASLFICELSSMHIIRILLLFSRSQEGRVLIYDRTGEQE